MPAYNVEKYIAASITSVLNQTYSNWELIIIDDGSKDGTADIIHSFIKKEERIKYLFQENAKQARARNNGISVAKGTILAFLDSDDLWLPNKLEQSLKSFDLNKYDLLFTNCYVTKDNIIDISCLDYKSMDVCNSIFSGNEGLIHFIEKNRIPTLTVLVKKLLVEKVCNFDYSCVPAEDFDLWIRLLKNGAVFKSISQPLSIYRVQESSSTASDRYATDLVLKIIEKNFNQEELKNLKVANHLKKWIFRWIDFYLCRNNLKQLENYLIAFNLNNFSIRLLFLLSKFIGIKNFKRIILRIL